jgi:DNA invertase Pin-like site-specific DNA recombinase
MNNLESGRMQYAMKDRLRELGWAEIEVVDEDQGRSADGTAERSGFDQMVSDVCLGRVGIVAARDLSRLSRNSRDWQQLIEVSRFVQTLLADHETIYDPRLSNDRLLLGVKGSINEYELDVLRQRAWKARHEKAILVIL